MARPWVLLSAAVSLDGAIDDATPRRLVLSSPADLDEVDAERAAADAILVGATTVRRDRSRLRVRSPELVATRVTAGRPAQPLRVVLSSRGELDPAAPVFAPGDGGTLVYLPSAVPPPRALVAVASVVGAGDPLDPRRVLADLHARGVHRLLVEGGSRVHALFLGAGQVDELRLAVAPLLVGDPAAPRFGWPAELPGRLRLLEARDVGGVAVLRYRVDRP